MMPKRMHNFFKGSCFTNKEIESELKKKKLNYVRPKNLYHEVSKHLKDGKIIGWFQGGAEFGPRALGNRSIFELASAEITKGVLASSIKILSTSSTMQKLWLL